MAQTPSTMLPLGTPLPAFNLKDTVSGEYISSEKLEGTLVLVGFICNHCPYVINIIKELTTACNEFVAQDVSVVMISSNDVDAYPQDGPEKMTEFAQEQGFKFAYCYDQTQEIAKSFDAACTPEFYLFNGDRTLIYRGQFDSSRPKTDKTVDGFDLREAVKLGLDGKMLEEQIPSVGCNIKWKS
ncbi:MAG TPA: thioredoxin family protein [Gammaproteobacteria bacterium]|nr:thioredoxin family protein [Gammaproteobacteria bacterium]MEC8010355.1 thioredoxin family protein [Pseudomonadota bacterium]HBF09035.1 thioredoxin family protein [Gammaproteobacteria bacterium]HCK93572.1 thioredoxin family protein [Gammaproteobacteria bacterium]|tara:strand:+ start:1866 stop:2417 length:552 start_codon:yes stop_codon:yes gene_type:complete